MQVHPIVVVATLLMVIPGRARADGLIYQLPEDQTWVSYDCEGAGIGSDGQVRVTVNGTMRVSSVGQETIDGQPCRWIELNSKFKFQRGDQEGEFADVIKMLIPAQYLKQGEDPRNHVIKAWRKDPTGVVRELDLRGEGAREIQSLDEYLSGSLEETDELKPALIDSKLGKLECQGRSGREVQQSGTVFVTETYVHPKAPFGVVRFHYEKQRGPQGGKRTMSLNLADHGTGAKSVLPESN